MAMKEYNLNKAGENVRVLLDKIDDLQEATTTKAGTMSADDKRRLDQVGEPLTILEIDELLNF